MICKTLHQSNIRTDPLRMRHMTYPSLPVNYFGYWPQVVFRGVGSDIFQFAFKGPVESPIPKWNILTYLPTTTRGLSKNLKNFQAPLHWYFDQDTLRCLLMVSCPILNLINSSPTFRLCTKNESYAWSTSWTQTQTQHAHTHKITDTVLIPLQQFNTMATVY